MTEKKEAWIILATLIASVSVAYALAWRGRKVLVRRIASLTVSAVSALVGLVGTAVYAVPALDDFRFLPLKVAIINNIVIWSICVAAWIIALKFIVYAIRKNPMR